jgi:hypothetical protein
MTTTIITTTNTINTIKTDINTHITDDARLEEEGAAMVVDRAQRRAIKRLRAAIEEKVEARRVAALRRKFPPRVEAQARAALAAARAATEAAHGAAEAGRAAAEAGRSLQALDDELREATRMEVGDDYYAEWHADGLGGVCVTLAARIAVRGVDVADGAERVAADGGASRPTRSASRKEPRPFLRWLLWWTRDYYDD